MQKTLHTKLNSTRGLAAGNDLARVLRWGPGYSGGEDPNTLLRDVIDAEEVRLDRWTVVFHPDDKGAEVDFTKSALPNSQGERARATGLWPDTRARARRPSGDRQRGTRVYV